MCTQCTSRIGAPRIQLKPSGAVVIPYFPARTVTLESVGATKVGQV